MNMLTNKIPFGLLSEEEKELFRNSINSCECYTESGTWNSWNSAGALTQDVVLRLKPKETFVDVEIEWVSKMAEVRHPENNKIYNITAKPVGWTLSGWALNGYHHDEGGVTTRRSQPLFFNTNGTVIQSKATYARFVKVGE
mgnify:CR=1 FL=1